MMMGGVGKPAEIRIQGGSLGIGPSYLERLVLRS